MKKQTKTLTVQEKCALVGHDLRKSSSPQYEHCVRCRRYIKVVYDKPAEEVEVPAEKQPGQATVQQKSLDFGDGIEVKFPPGAVIKVKYP